MRIIVVGASGDIGQAACAELGQRHDLIRVGRSSGDFQLDMSDPLEVSKMFDRVQNVDAVVVTAGDAHFARLEEQTPESICFGLQQKVMGQINLVLAGLTRINDGGSFTLTSGVLDRDPIEMGVAAATANGALAGFVVGSSIEMPRQMRINVVSPGLLDVSVARYGQWFCGHEPVASERVGRAYAKSVEGRLTGQVLIVE
ncbi:short chain dehydrogenase [Planktotalea sp.]|uniref:short chain dehydrogenase n=1 Tax=Planktotalea sp. TaxID=2029877 RepID=UPI003296DE3F